MKGFRVVRFGSRVEGPRCGVQNSWFERINRTHLPRTLGLRVKGLGFGVGGSVLESMVFDFWFTV